jgi:peroxiredoxin Q/BCP
VALHFLLKTECPYCLRHTHDYAQKAASLPDVINVFLKPDSDAEIKSWAAKLETTGAGGPVIYRDPDARLATQFGIPGGYHFHGQTVHFPAVVLLGPDGREVFRHVGKGSRDRYPFEMFATKLAELKRSPNAVPGSGPGAAPH